MQQSIDRGHLKTQDVTRRFNNVQFQVIVLWDTITILSNYRSIEDIQDYIKEYILPIPHIRLYGSEYFPPPTVEVFYTPAYTILPQKV